MNPLQKLEELGISRGSIEMKGGKLYLRCHPKVLTRMVKRFFQENREQLLLILERGIRHDFCPECGRLTEFHPASEVMDVFRRWECGECGWKLWRREQGEYPVG